MLIKICSCRPHTIMSDYLTELVEYQLYIAKTIKTIGTPKFMVPASDNSLSNETKKDLFVRKE